MGFRKPSTCSCGPGGYALNGSRWVVVERRQHPKSSRLKCLQCGWKWWSRCKYVSVLPDHREQSRTGMTDEHVLDRIANGTLTVLVDQARVFSFAKGKWTELRVIERESSKSKYRFVEICKDRKKKKVALHKLVWMFANRRLVPEGFDVDHIEENANDCIDNLQILESSVNRSRSKDDIPF